MLKQTTKSMTYRLTTASRCTSSFLFSTSLSPRTTATTSLANRCVRLLSDLFSLAARIHRRACFVLCLSFSARGLGTFFAPPRRVTTLTAGDANRTASRRIGSGGARVTECRYERVSVTSLAALCLFPSRIMILVSKLSSGSSAGGMNTGLNASGKGASGVDDRAGGLCDEGVGTLGGGAEEVEGSVGVAVDIGRQRRGTERPRARLLTLIIILEASIMVSWR